MHARSYMLGYGVHVDNWTVLWIILDIPTAARARVDMVSDRSGCGRTGVNSNDWKSMKNVLGTAYCDLSFDPPE